jgi:hypothetical protein
MSTKSAIVFSFIGELPSYCLLAVKQLRYFYNGPIYFICDDLKYQEQLCEMGCTIIKYDSVIDTKFIEIVNKNIKRFAIVHSLGPRKLLFIRSFERFHLLNNLWKLNPTIQDFIFIEIDNLVYSDPREWILNDKPIQWMMDNDDRISTGICIFRNSEYLNMLCNFYYEHIDDSSVDFLSEMGANWKFTQKYEKYVHILPSYWNNLSNVGEDLSKYSEYFMLYNKIFDPSSYGVYLFNTDPIHGKTNYNKWGKLNLVRDNIIIDWIIDESGRKIPHINLENKKYIPIQNLHIHSKNLHLGMSL